VACLVWSLVPSFKFDLLLMRCQYMLGRHWLRAGQGQTTESRPLYLRFDNGVTCHCLIFFRLLSSFFAYPGLYDNAYCILFLRAGEQHGRRLRSQWHMCLHAPLLPSQQQLRKFENSGVVCDLSIFQLLALRPPPFAVHQSSSGEEKGLS
jgi:diadenosine tetraphosphatase ApaH/serine/threonine PP2A family protein phosphatase